MAAAKIPSAAFLAPLIETSPTRGLPPDYIFIHLNPFTRSFKV